MNKVILMGRLTKEPELKEVGKDKHKVVLFSIAVPRIIKEQVDFINCVAWDITAELISNYLTKGSRILIEGEIRVDSYEDKNKNKQYITRVLVSNFEFADTKKEEATNEQETVDDLPF